MADALRTLAEALERAARDALNKQDLDVRLDALWRDRARLREGMRARARERFPDAAADGLLDLARLPAHPRLCFSGSHAPDLGGFACAEGATIGFDVELAERVSLALASRVARDADELAAAPEPALLWCAKEAAFKAARGEARTASEMRVTGWRPAPFALGPAFHCEAASTLTTPRLAFQGFAARAGSRAFCFFARALN